MEGELKRIAALLVATAAMALGCGGMLAQGAVADLQQLYAEGECEQVITRSVEYAPFLEDEPARIAEANFIRANCLVRLGRKAEAVAIFRYVAEQHPTSPYAYQSQVMIDGLRHGDAAPSPAGASH